MSNSTCSMTAAPSSGSRRGQCGLDPVLHASDGALALMAKRPSPKADPAQLASEQRIASKTATKTAGKVNDSSGEKVLLAIVGFMLTGVVGTVITTWIQQRGWAWQESGRQDREGHRERHCRLSRGVSISSMRAGTPPTR